RTRTAYEAARFSDLAAATDLLAELKDATVLVSEERARNEALHVASGFAGQLEFAREQDLSGRFVQEGEVVAHVLPSGPRRIRAVLRHADAELVRRQLRSASVRFADDLGKIYRAKIVREIPAGGTVLPSVALSIEGGGEIAALEGENGEFEALDRVFQFDIELENPPALPPPFGMRAIIRLELEPLPI